MNDLIEIPKFSCEIIRVIVVIRGFVNGVQRESCESPYSIMRFRSYRKLNNQISIFFDGFLGKLFKSGGYNHSVKEKYLIYDPFESVKNIKDEFPKLKLDRFLKLKGGKLEFSDNKILPSGINNLCYKVDYIEVRSQIISYLIQSVGETEDVLKLQRLFSSVSNCKSYKEEINKKVKYLLGLDLSTYFKELNDDIEKRSKFICGG